MSARPRSLVLVGGTGTEVGKTWVAAAVAGQLREEGWVISARKPAQSFDPHDDAPHDSEVLGEATNESPDAVCPPHRNYGVAMAPPMAATSLGRPSFTTSDLVDEVTGSWPPHSVDVGIVELAGGWRSPQAAPDAAGDDCRAFASLLAPDLVVLVAGTRRQPGGGSGGRGQAEAAAAGEQGRGGGGDRCHGVALQGRGGGTIQAVRATGARLAGSKPTM